MLTAQASQANASVEYDAFDFIRILTAAYAKAFTRNDVLKILAASGMHPFNPSAVLGVPRPFYEEGLEHIFGVEELESPFEKTQTVKRPDLCFQRLV